MATETYDIIVVGGGTAGCFAAATAAGEGLDVALLERKSAEEAGHIACGDAIKGKSAFPDVIDCERLRRESFTNDEIRNARFENPQTGDTLDIPLEQSGAVLDRKRYGEVLLEETERTGAQIHYDTVVTDVCQTESGRVTGVTATRAGTSLTYEATVTIDAAGALSLLQDKADFSGTTFDTNVEYSQFCSAYREIIELEEPIDWEDSIVFKPTEELGYLWYFPRSPTEINAGLGFQMNKPHMELVEVLKNDLRSRPEFENATVTDKLGAALPTRRPYDSAVAPGFISVGDAAGHVNPITGGGIPGAAKAANWAADCAIDAVETSSPDEATVWAYNQKVQTGFGKRFAAMDLYNIFGGANDVEELTAIVTAMPGEQLVDAIAKKGTASMGLWLKLKTLLKTYRHWPTLYDLYKVQGKARELIDCYEQYPSRPEGLSAWQTRRDSILQDVYQITGADPKY